MAPASRHEEALEQALGLFGSPKTFALDRSAIQRRYYELSRELHPDRFAAASPSDRAQAIERMSGLNEAYELLKDPDSWRNHLLGEASGSTPAQLPMELASEWFELQDEGPQSEAIRAFRSRVQEEVSANQMRIQRLESEIDSMSAGDAAERTARIRQLKEAVSLRNTLRSLLKDVDRAIGPRA